MPADERGRRPPPPTPPPDIDADRALEREPPGTRPATPEDRRPLDDDARGGGAMLASDPPPAGRPAPAGRGSPGEEEAMIAVANRIFVKPEYAERFEGSFRRRARLVDAMPGFVSNQVLRPTREGDPYVVLTFWASRADFEAWTRSDAFVKGHARSGTLPGEAFSAPNQLEVHEVMLDSSRPAPETTP